MAKFRFQRSKRKGKYKSGLEADFAKACEARGLKVDYEPDKFRYSRPSHSIPDWKIGEGVYIETKGYLAPSNRANLLAFREQHPNITLLLAFGNSDNRLNPRSSTTYGEWATKHNFEWCDLRKGFPIHWWEKYGKQKDESASSPKAGGRRASRNTRPNTRPSRLFT